MRLAVGRSLGPYEILSPLGAGGMGEVYRARDSRLGREVAIKVLPAERMADEGRKSRFAQEARAASALNHPHIVTIHEIDSVDGVDFIVMEYLRGQTLDALIPKTGMRLGEALRIATPIADALAAAHAKGIVHRDLKPSNVVVTPDGVVKVLDFGLAKLMADGDDDGEVDVSSPTATAAPLSSPGTVSGTAGYMSPEQATGAKVDARSDIFSFGAVLYEIVTGRRAFGGRGPTEMMAAVVRDQPRPPRDLVPDLPDALERIILLCLRKEPDRRSQSMAHVKVELIAVKEDSDSQTARLASSQARGRRSWRLAAAAVAGLTALVLGGVAFWWGGRPPDPPPVVVQLTSERRAARATFSPDGDEIAYASTGHTGTNWDIWVKMVGGSEARRLTTDPMLEGQPEWSPDGKLIAFLGRSSPGAAVRLYVVSPIGGSVRRLSDLPIEGQTSWSPDGKWLLAARARDGTEPPGGIEALSVESGEGRSVTDPSAGTFHAQPALSPDGGRLAYAACEGPDNFPACNVVVAPIEALRSNETPRILTDRHQWISGITWTRDGRSILFSSLTHGRGMWRVRADGGAPPERVEMAGRGTGVPVTARGRDRIAYVRETGDHDIIALRAGGPVTVVGSTFWDQFPRYSPDGRRIAYCSDESDQTEVWVAESDGSGARRLTHGPGRHQCSPWWSPDGRTIVFDSLVGQSRADLWTIGVDGSGLRQITRHPADDVFPAWSRDGRVYFVSHREKRRQVWRLDPRTGAEEQVTRDGGDYPIPSFDGRVLYYHGESGALLAQPTTGGEASTLVPCAWGLGYAAAPGGLYYLGCETSDFTQKVLHHWNDSTRQDRVVMKFDGDNIAGMGVSPDGSSVLVSSRVWTANVMMIDNFR